MARHNVLGKQGEQIAASWLLTQGFFLLETNWRIGRLEIDIIASKGDWLHFIEVKTRTDGRWGGPEDSVQTQKFKNIRRASQSYLKSIRHFRWIQFDIVAITFSKLGDPVVEFFEDIYL